MQLLGALVLIVKADDILREALEAALWSAGFAVQSGSEAMLLMHREIPSVIILDLVSVEGVRVLTTMRAQPQFASIPVLALTGSETPINVLPGLAPVRIVSKPLDVDAVVETVGALLLKPNEANFTG